MGRRFVLMAIGMLLLVLCINTALSAEVMRWHINLGTGYGIEHFSFEKPNEFIRELNKWTLNVSRIDLNLEPIGDSFTSYSIDWRVDLNPRWRIGLDLNYLPIKEVTGNGEIYNELPDNGWHSVSVDTDIKTNLGIANLVFYYNLNPGKRFTPFLSAGLGYYFLKLDGSYHFFEDTFTPPEDYEYKTLSESVSISDSDIGYALGAGINWRVLKWHFDVDIALSANYNFAPKLNGEAMVEENEGFSSLPVTLGPFTVDVSGSGYKIWTAVRF